jgi:peptide/nickel transport system substrate-binding protein
MKKKVLLISLELLLVMSLVAVGCAAPTTPPPTTPPLTTPPPTTPPPTTPVAEHWTVALATNPCISIESLAIGETGTDIIWHHIYEPLFQDEVVLERVGTKYVRKLVRHVPKLATGYKWVDTTHLRFTLRKGVKFQNGEDFTAEDVKYTWDFAAKMPFGGRYTQVNVPGLFSSVQIIDPYTVEFTLKAPSPDAFFYLQYMTILPKSRGWSEESVAAFTKNPVGTGPYKIKKFVKDQYWELEAWDGYRDGVARPKYLTIRYIPEPSARLAALLAGEVDIIYPPATEHVPQIEANPNFTVFTIEEAKSYSYLFNYFKPPFNDVRVRQAMNLAVDRKTIVNTLLKGNAKIIATCFTPPEVWGLPQLEPYPYDPQRARQLLADAGYAKGFTCELQCTSGEEPKDLEVAQAVQSYLADVGIKVNIKPMELATLYNNYFAGTFDMSQSKWGVGSFSVWRIMRWNLLYYDILGKVPGGAMPTSMAKLFDLWTEVASVTNPAEQLRIYTEVNQIAYDAAANLFMYAVDGQTAYNKAKIGEWEPVQTFYENYVQYWDYRGMYPADREIKLEKLD